MILGKAVLIIGFLSLFLGFPVFAFADFDRGLKAYNTGDYQTALKEWLVDANNGNSAAQFNMGIIHYNELKDYDKAAYWYGKAADQGNAKAQFLLGKMMFQGKVEPKDYAEMARLFRLSANQGYASAQSFMGLFYTSGDKWYTNSGIPRDYVEALRWYEKAAAQGDAMGQTNLGGLYEWGMGVEENHIKALYWYTQGAEQNWAIAQMTLGDIYQEGRAGLEKNYLKAISWYQRAAEQWHFDSQIKLGKLYVKLATTGPYKIKAVKWFNIALYQAPLISFQTTEIIDSLDAVVKTMKAAQIAEGEKLANEWIGAHK